MLLRSLQYVVTVATPALLVAITVDALRRMGARGTDAVAWATMACGLLLALVYPSVLTEIEERTGLPVPVSVVGFVAVGAAAVAYARSSSRIKELERQVVELRDAASDDSEA